MCAEIFGLSDYDMHDPVGKEKSLRESVNMDDLVPKMNKVTGLNIIHRGFVANSPRQILQYFGTDYVRNVKDSYWVDRVLDKIATGTGNFLVPDTRFPNEVAALKEIGAKIVRIVRSGKATDGNSVHVSETALDDYRADHTFVFKDGELDQLKATAEAFAEEYSVLYNLRDPYACLQESVDDLNLSLGRWGSQFGWGANIVPTYDREGKKSYKIGHAGPLPTVLATKEQIESAGKIIKEALDETLRATVPGSPRGDEEADAIPPAESC
jgi:hypothetical protein